MSESFDQTDPSPSLALAFALLWQEFAQSIDWTGSQGGGGAAVHPCGYGHKIVRTSIHQQSAQ